MSNLKKMFYKDYYDGVDYSSGDYAENQNARLFRRKNKEIVGYNPNLSDDKFSSLDLTNKGLPFHTTFELTTTNPGLIIGTGYMHKMHTKEEFKLGFFFDHTTGLPILPGSSVKGVLRSAFPTFESKKDDVLAPDFWAKDKKEKLKITEKQKQKARFIQALLPFLAEKTDDEVFTLVHQIEKAIFEGTDISATEKEVKEQKVRMSQRCIFYDARIKIAAPNGKIVGSDVLTPHGDNPLKNPIPLPFLKVLPAVTFEFSFALPALEIGDDLLAQNDLQQLFKDILLYLGMGAKTNVGYGQFTDKKPAAVVKAEREAIQRARPQSFVPSDIPRNAPIGKATLVDIIVGVCVFQFTYEGVDFQFVKTTANITKKWKKKGYDQDPIVGNTYNIVLQGDIVKDQKNPNFSVSKPKES